MIFVHEDSHDDVPACPYCDEMFNCFPVTGALVITADGKHEDALWRCDSCGNRWTMRVAVQESEADNG